MRHDIGRRQDVILHVVCHESSDRHDVVQSEITAQLAEHAGVVRSGLPSTDDGANVRPASGDHLQGLQEVRLALERINATEHGNERDVVGDAQIPSGPVCVPAPRSGQIDAGQDGRRGNCARARDAVRRRGRPEDDHGRSELSEESRRRLACERRPGEGVVQHPDHGHLRPAACQARVEERRVLGSVHEIDAIFADDVPQLARNRHDVGDVPPTRARHDLHGVALGAHTLRPLPVTKARQGNGEPRRIGAVEDFISQHLGAAAAAADRVDEQHPAGRGPVRAHRLAFHSCPLLLRLAPGASRRARRG